MTYEISLRQLLTKYQAEGREVKVSMNGRAFFGKVASIDDSGFLLKSNFGEAFIEFQRGLILTSGNPESDDDKDDDSDMLPLKARVHPNGRIPRDSTGNIIVGK